jgi:hypothetical protein
MIGPKNAYSEPAPKQVGVKKLPNYQCECGRYMDVHIQNNRSRWDTPENYLWFECDYCTFETWKKAAAKNEKAIAQIKKARTKKVIQKSDIKVKK